MTTRPEPLVSVLFVDDEPSVTEALRRALHQHPFEVHTASSGLEALDLLAARAIDVVVSDEVMPQMRGSELLARIHREHPGTARILLTGNASLEDAAQAVNAARVSRILLKPCEIEVLADSIVSALEERDREREYDRWRKSLATHEGHELHALLDRAMERARMVFQPVVLSADESLFGYEALVRVDVEGCHGPGALFSLAASLDRIVELDRHLVALVAERAHEAPDDALLLVNLNPRTIELGRTLEVSRALLPFAERVVLEVTEQSAYAEVPHLSDQVTALRDHGFRIALDDLGSGYAGLTAFAVLLPDLVKVEMELIHGIDQVPAKSKLVGAMARLCRDLDILTVAEGVETDAQRAHVTRLGLDLLQGHAIARPAPDFALPRRRAS